MAINWLRKVFRLIAATGIYAVSVAAASAQAYSERTALTCLQIDAESAYTQLEALGWQRIAPAELSIAEKRVFGANFFLGAAKGAQNGSGHTPSLKQSVKISETRVEQEISRLVKGSSVLGGAFYKSPEAQTFLKIQTKRVSRFAQTHCTFYLSGQAAINVSKHETKHPYVEQIGSWDRHSNGLSRSVDHYVFNAEGIGEIIGLPFPVDAIIAASVTQQNVEKE